MNSKWKRKALLVVFSALFSLSILSVRAQEQGGKQGLSAPVLQGISASLVPGCALPVYTFNYKSCRAALVIIDGSRYRLLPSFSDKTSTTAEQVQRSGALAGINGGYFNLSDGESASFVVRNAKLELDPRLNRALTENEKLKDFLPAIFNRSELRILEAADGRLDYEICEHSAPVSGGFRLLDSIQGGPLLLPTLTAAKEAFLRTNIDGSTVDAIGVKRPAARTAFAIVEQGKERRLILLAIAGRGQDEFSSGLTLEELAELLGKLGAQRALNFDGGTSTTMVVKAGSKLKTLVGKVPQTRVKSTLLVLPKRF
ncbi:MAG: phosphodiester glycosidase family protein [Candidatus Obscuribacterales bacterium]|nr:phosphodiester glycosidase family protein [Candidatus Obscuribacterales bacterium]